MKKHTVKTAGRIGCAALAAVMAMSSGGTAFASAAVTKKDETVYSTLDANGRLKSTTVSDWLHSDGAAAEFLDKSDLTGIKNVKSNENPVRDGSSLVWQLNPSSTGKTGSNIYYEGTTDKKLPLTVSVAYYLNGKEVSKLKENQRTNLRKGVIGFVFQSFNLIEELNVYENIELPLLYMKMPATERKQKVKEAMDRMAISHREKHFPQQLSGGQQQRVAIARAVVANPDLILADEPTGNLDSKNGAEVMNLLTDLNREGTTIVMVTHSMHDAGYAGRIINLFDGRVVPEVVL